MAVCTISQLSAFGCSKTLPGKKLVGTFKVARSEDTEFPIGTVVFDDNTGKLACHLSGDFQPCWLSGRVALTEWNFMLNRLPNGQICSMYLEVVQVELDEESMETPETNSDRTLLEQFLPTFPAPATISTPHRSTNLIGKVHITRRDNSFQQNAKRGSARNKNELARRGWVRET
ncbi:398_t:CDS:2 [Acaulospora colombiana]|uniref:398_t:CDS:1 n=1 Tax=Acaulospora colombiana TaxID=27376 RepID=A0ACA9PFZ5_9GLOM|nr:398_t:CDS:2 [Acaulospora colombiana]